MYSCILKSLNKNTALSLSGRKKFYLLKVVADLTKNIFPYHYILNEALTKVLLCFEKNPFEGFNIFEGFWVVLFHFLVLLLLPQSQSSEGFVLISWSLSYSGRHVPLSSHNTGRTASDVRHTANL